MLELLRKIFRREKKAEETKPEPKDFLILRDEEIEQYVKSIVEREEEQILKEVQDFFFSLSEKINDLEKSLVNLEQENISLPDKQVEKVVSSKKQEFLNKMKVAIEKVRNIDTSNFENFSRTYDEAMRSLKEANVTSLNEFIVIKNYYSNSKDVLDRFKGLFDIFFSFQDKIKNEKSVETQEIKKCLLDFMWVKSEISSKKKEKDEISRKIVEKKKEIDEKKNKLSILENSEEMNKLVELQKEKMKISYKEKELASICVERFSKIDHILKKVRRQLETSGLKEVKVLSELIASPFDATINNDIQLALENVLEYMKRSNFPQEEISKIENLVEEKFFSRLKSEYEELEKRLQEIEKEIERIDVVNRKLKVENEIKSLEFEVNELEKKLRTVDEKIFEIESLLPKLKESLERKISKISGREVKIID